MDSKRESLLSAESPPIEPHMKGINPHSLNFLFVTILFANTLINVDHGIIPAITGVLKEDLELDNAALGFLGSIVFVGLTAGSMLAGPIFNFLNAKLILCVSWGCNIVFLFLFTIGNANFYWIMCLSRAATGFFQTFIVIFLPVWVDRFGSKK